MAPITKREENGKRSRVPRARGCQGSALGTAPNPALPRLGRAAGEGSVGRGVRTTLRWGQGSPIPCPPSLSTPCPQTPERPPLPWHTHPGSLAVPGAAPWRLGRNTRSLGKPAGINLGCPGEGMALLQGEKGKPSKSPPNPPAKGRAGGWTDSINKAAPRKWNKTAQDLIQPRGLRETAAGGSCRAMEAPALPAAWGGQLGMAKKVFTEVHRALHRGGRILG